MQTHNANSETIYANTQCKFGDDDEEVETEVRKWLRQQSKDIYAAGFETLVK
jgi:hypothetical protein